MSEDIITLARQISGKPVYRRRHSKPDGRDVLLYGYARHTGKQVEGEELDMLAGGDMRRHPLRGDWSVYAAGRQNRTFKPSAAADPLAPSRPGAPLTEIPFEDFELAVFGNRFPGLHPSLTAPGHSLVEARAANGMCEVIVFAPEGEGSLATLGQARRRLLIEAWVDRYEAMFEAGCAFVLPFENRGDEAGVTLHHPHGQIYGFPIVPTPQANAVAAFEAGYDLAGELRGWKEDFWIAEAGGLVAFAPPYARFPYETWIAPLEPVSGPWAFTEEQTDGFAHLLGEMTARYDAFFRRTTAAFLTLHAAPYGRDGSFQFTAQTYPMLRGPDRVKYLASVEQATGVFTVDIMPEQTARALRNVSL